VHVRRNTMSQQQRIPWTKLVASASCAAALGTFMAVTPTTTQAQAEGNCVYAGKEYSPGACRSGQRCSDDGKWFDDPSCTGAE
jgi:uncharacterized membrane protein